MLPDKNGVYIGKPTSMAIEEKQSGTAQVNIAFKLTEFRGLDGKGSEPVDLSITAYLNVVKKNGEFNENNLKSLADSFGWVPDPEKPFESLSKIDLAPIECQVVITDDKDQNGTLRKSVRYVNPKDYAGSPTVKNDPTVAVSLDQRYGAKMRALAIKPSSGIKPATSSAGGTATATVNGADTGRKIAWQKFTSVVDAYAREKPDDAYTGDERKEVFQKLARNFAGTLGKQSGALDPADFAALTHLIETSFDAGTRDIIPF